MYLKNVSRVFDLCIWRNEFIIIATYNENSVKILNFHNLDVMKSKKLKNHKDPANILKVIKIDAKKSKSLEGLVLFQSIGNESQIKFYG